MLTLVYLCLFHFVLFCLQNWTQFSYKHTERNSSKGLCSFHTINMFLCTEIVVITFGKMKSAITWHVKTCDSQHTLALPWFLLRFFFPFADICVTLEAVIIAGSVKESGCDNILHLRFVTKKMVFRCRVGISESCLTRHVSSSILWTAEPSL